MPCRGSRPSGLGTPACRPSPGGLYQCPHLPTHLMSPCCAVWVYFLIVLPCCAVCVVRVPHDAGDHGHAARQRGAQGQPECRGPPDSWVLRGAVQGHVLHTTRARRTHEGGGGGRRLQLHGLRRSGMHTYKAQTSRHTKHTHKARTQRAHTRPFSQGSSRRDCIALSPFSPLSKTAQPKTCFIALRRSNLCPRCAPLVCVLGEAVRPGEAGEWRQPPSGRRGGVLHPGTRTGALGRQGTIRKYAHLTDTPNRWKVFRGRGYDASRC